MTSKVEEKINNVLMESSLLNLAFNRYNFSETIFYFYDKDEKNVKHFFYVNEYSEAVYFYNKLTIEGSKNNNIETNKYKFDYKEINNRTFFMNV